MTRSASTRAAHRRLFVAGLAVAAVVVSAQARADEAADCDAGIAMITEESAKQQPKAVADALKTALGVAKREKGEQEYDECLDAVEDARKALKK